MLFTSKPLSPQGRHVLITGASSGLGRETALHLAEQGFQVIAGVRRQEDGERLANACPSGRISTLLIDVTDEESIGRAAAQVAEKVGDTGLWGLVNNAGICISAPLECVSSDLLRRQLEVNLIGQLAVTRAILPLLRRGGAARLVNVTSGLGSVAIPYLGAYSAAQFSNVPDRKLRLGEELISPLHALYDGLQVDGAPRPAHRAAEHPVWVVTRYRDARKVLNHPGVRRDARQAAELYAKRTGSPRAGIGEGLSHHMLNLDPPDHTRLRSLVGRAFTPRQVERLQPHIERITEALLDAMAGREQADLMADFAIPLTIAVIFELLGIPEAEREHARQSWERQAELLSPEEAQALADAQVDYLRVLLEAKRRQPADDVYSGLVQAADESGQLSEAELVSMAHLLMMSGFETTMNMIGNALVTLLVNPEQLALLRAQPELLPNAMEELVRHDSPVRSRPPRPHPQHRWPSRLRLRRALLRRRLAGPAGGADRHPAPARALPRPPVGGAPRGAAVAADHLPPRPDQRAGAHRMQRRGEHRLPRQPDREDRPMNAKEILVHSLRLLENGDARGWCDLFHPEGVLEFPYAPPGWKTRFEGRETIWAHMRLFPEHLTVRFTDVQFYETADPDLAIGEFHGDGVATVSGGKLAQDYISVLRTRDGQILLYRDFWNPLRHLEALGGVEAAAKIVQGA